MEASWLGSAENFARLTQQLSVEPTEQRTLEHIAQLAVQTVGGCDGCGISLRHGNGPVATPAATSQDIIEPDDLQYLLGQGPCLDAIRRDGTYLAGDLSTDQRWPQWSRAGSQMGFRPILSVRLISHRDVLGALNLYSHQLRAYDEDAMDLAHAYAEHAAGALAAARAVEGLGAAMTSATSLGWPRKATSSSATWRARSWTPRGAPHRGPPRRPPDRSSQCRAHDGPHQVPATMARVVVAAGTGQPLARR